MLIPGDDKQAEGGKGKSSVKEMKTVPQTDFRLTDALPLRWVSQVYLSSLLPPPSLCSD